MTPAELAALVRAATTELLARRAPDAREIDWAREIIRPRDRARGEYATAVALRAPGTVDSRELAAELAATLAGRTGISSAEVSGPGFVNIRLAPSARGAVVGQILAEGAGHGRADLARRPTIGDPAALAERVGVPAARYAVARGGGRNRLDEGLLRRSVEANPAFRVRFAHARLCATARHAAALGVTAGQAYELLEHPAETALIGVLGEFAQAARTDAERLARYLERLADQLDRLEREVRVLPIGDEATTELHRARVALCAAARQVFANGLEMLGVDAPERL